MQEQVQAFYAAAYAFYMAMYAVVICERPTYCDFDSFQPIWIGSTQIRTWLLLVIVPFQMKGL